MRRAQNTHHKGAETKMPGALKRGEGKIWPHLAAQLSLCGQLASDALAVLNGILEDLRDALEGLAEEVIELQGKTPISGRISTATVTVGV